MTAIWSIRSYSIIVWLIRFSEDSRLVKDNLFCPKGWPSRCGPVRAQHSQNDQPFRARGPSVRSRFNLICYRVPTVNGWCVWGRAQWSYIFNFSNRLYNWYFALIFRKLNIVGQGASNFKHFIRGTAK